MSSALTYPIGALARLTDTVIETIRYYERIGLLPSPPRSSGNRRIYLDVHLQRLTFIRRCRALGFSLAQIRELTALADRRPSACAPVARVLAPHLVAVRTKIADLLALQSELESLYACCERGERPECGAIATLFAARTQ